MNWPKIKELREWRGAEWSRFLEWRRFVQWLGEGKGLFPLSLILISAAVFTYFAVCAITDPYPRQYALDYGPAQRIEPSQGTPSGYFRKTLYLPQLAELAWLQVSGTDTLNVYVNGTLLSIPTSTGAPTVPTYTGTLYSANFDIKPYLIHGKNVIAIYVPRMTFPGAAQLVVRGAYKLVGKPLTEFYSDGSWKASGTPDGVLRGVLWYDRNLNDEMWASAKIATSREWFSLIQPVSFDPRVLALEPEGNWIGPTDTGWRDVVFQTTIDRGIGDGVTWLQLAASGSYTVTINNRLITFLDSTAPSTAKPLLNAFDVTQWLHPGGNTLSVRVRQDQGAVALFATGFTERWNGTLRMFGTDKNWRELPSSISEPLSPAMKARELGTYGMSPWGFLPQTLGLLPDLPTDDMRVAWDWGWTAIGVTLLVFGAWYLFCLQTSRDREISFTDMLAADALLHLPVLLLAGAMWLLSCDARFMPDWCFQPFWFFMLVAAWLGVRAWHFCPPRWDAMKPVQQRLLTSWETLPERAAQTVSPAKMRAYQQYAVSNWLWIAGGLIVFIGFVLRAWNLTTIAIDHDEMVIVDFSKGWFTSAFPHLKNGGFFHPMETYELTSIPMALSMLFFGQNEFAYRLPALIFGTLSVGLIGWIGLRLMDWRVGLVSALFAALMPMMIGWSQNAFYPAQTQFFGLVTILLFYEAIRRQPYDNRLLTFASVAFVMTCFSWEPSGFLLVALFFGLVAVEWGQWGWIKNLHLWRCTYLVLFIVGVQLCYRQIILLPYLGIAKTLNSVTTPSLVFLDPKIYDPYVYFRYFLLQENYFLLTLIFAIGFFFCWRHRGIRYLGVLLFVLFNCYTHFLPVTAPRYTYMYQPYLILTAVGICFVCWDRIRQFADSLPFDWTKGIGRGVAVASLALLFLGTNGFFLKTYRLSVNPPAPVEKARLDVYKYDYRGACRYVADHMAADDGAIVWATHVFRHYTGRDALFTPESTLSMYVIYDGTLARPHYTDIFTGTEALRSLNELREARAHYRRLWIMAVPYSVFKTTVSQDISAYLKTESQTVFESYDAQVMLLNGVPPPSTKFSLTQANLSNMVNNKPDQQGAH